MGGDRIRLNDESRALLFDNILQDNQISIIDLSKKLGYGYSAVKNWCSGTRLIPEEVFNELLDISSPDIKRKVSKGIETYPSNWGNRLGGLESYRKYKNQINSRMAFVRSFRHTVDLPQVDPQIWELVGICMGDGCLSKFFSTYENRWCYQTLFTGNMTDDLHYYLDYVIPILQRRFNLSGYYYKRSSEHVIGIPIKSRLIFDYFNSLGMPIGEKKNKLRITEQIFNSPIDVKASVLRGLLDTDGCLYARKDEDYKYLELKISSGSKSFLYDMGELLNNLDFPAYVHWQNKRDSGDVVLRGNRNIRRWMYNIGTSHPLIKERYGQWIKTGRLLPKGS